MNVRIYPDFPRFLVSQKSVEIGYEISAMVGIIIENPKLIQKI
jgi:hypothetical protein